MADNYVKVCPWCGSREVDVDFDNGAKVAYGANLDYRCLECGFEGPVFPEMTEEARKKYRESKKTEEGV